MGFGLLIYAKKLVPSSDAPSSDGWRIFKFVDAFNILGGQGKV